MGKSSFPVLNKVGGSTMWDNVWDDSSYYNVKFEEDIFIKIFFELFFKERLFKHNFLYSNSFFTNLKNFYLSKLGMNLDSYNIFKDTFGLFFKPNPIVFYFMKFHVMRIESVSLVFLKLFFPIRKKKSIIKNIKLRKKIPTLIYRFLRTVNLFFEFRNDTFSNKNF